MNASEYSKWIDSLYSQSRELISKQPDLFRAAGAELANIFSEEFVKNPYNDSDPLESPCQSHTPMQLLVTRIMYARNEAVFDSSYFMSSPLDFGPTRIRADRESAARMAMLAILLAADPDANEYITPQICELAKLEHEPFKMKNGKYILGRSIISWCWGKEDEFLCRKAMSGDCPTPKALQVLESALELLCKPLPAKNVLEMTPPISQGEEADADFRPIQSFPTEIHGRIRQAASSDRKSLKVRKQNPTGQQVEYSYADAVKWWPSDLKQYDSAPR